MTESTISVSKSGGTDFPVLHLKPNYAVLSDASAVAYSILAAIKKEQSDQTDLQTGTIISPISPSRTSDSSRTAKSHPQDPSVTSDIEARSNERMPIPFSGGGIDREREKRANHCGSYRAPKEYGAFT